MQKNCFKHSFKYFPGPIKTRDINPSNLVAVEKTLMACAHVFPQNTLGWLLSVESYKDVTYAVFL